MSHISPAELQNIRQEAEAMLAQVTQTMFGLDKVIKLCLVALYADGHVLLEGNPGLGKTALVKSLAELLGFQYGRIQFTPDLMPADITGTMMPDLKGGRPEIWRFQPGPIFTQLLLADEINRASPKTQAALLEAMAEYQVTVLGEKHALVTYEDGGRGKGEPKTPFMVLATQNPIDHQGVYELPEAQIDRFLFKIIMPTPDAQTLMAIMHKEADERENQQSRGASQARFLFREHFADIRRYGRSIAAAPSLKRHIINMVLASNGQIRQLKDISRDQKKKVQDLAPLFRFGLGPRAAIGLLKAAKVWSLLWGQNLDAVANGDDLAPVLVPTLRHRLHLQYGWEDDFDSKAHQVHGFEDSLAGLVIALARATMPNRDSYREFFERGLEAL